MQRRMFLYPRNAQEEGAAAVTGRLRRAGMSSVAVPTSYHANKFISPCSPAKKVFSPEDGTVYVLAELASVAEQIDFNNYGHLSLRDTRRIEATAA